MSELNITVSEPQVFQFRSTDEYMRACSLLKSTGYDLYTLDGWQLTITVYAKPETAKAA